MMEEEDISAIKRKNQLADNALLAGPGKDIDLDDEEEENQLINQSAKQRVGTDMNLLANDYPGDRTKAKGMVDSDIEDMVRSAGKGALKAEKLLDGEDGDLDLDDSQRFISQEDSRIDTKENLIGPVKSEFEELQRKITERTKELEVLEHDFYKRVSAMSVELEGIGPEQEEELERHRHLYEMQQLMELEKRMARVEKEKVRLLQQEQRVTSHLTFRSKVLGEELAELEQMQDAEARKRELTLTKLYARLNSRIK